MSFRTVSSRMPGFEAGGFFSRVDKQSQHRLCERSVRGVSSKRGDSLEIADYRPRVTSATTRGGTIATTFPDETVKEKWHVGCERNGYLQVMSFSFWTRTTVKSALSPCPRRRITYIRMCSEITCYSGSIQGRFSHCHFRNNK